jgi:uncharacterized coiled-coil protein SlyX
MTKIQMEQRIKDLENQVALQQVKLDVATKLKDEAMKEYDKQEAKIKNLKAVLTDLLVNEPQQEED